MEYSNLEQAYCLDALLEQIVINFNETAMSDFPESRTHSKGKGKDDCQSRHESFA